MNTLKKFKKKELLPHIFITDLYLDALMDLKKNEQKVLFWIIQKFHFNLYSKISQEYYLQQFFDKIETDTGLNTRSIKSAIKILKDKKLILIDELLNKTINISLNPELIFIDEETGRH
jgi:hypothetical protein